VVTLLTDFGLSDSYVAEMKAVLYGQRSRIDPVIVDITHEIPPQDVLAGSIMLERALSAFPPGTIHLAIVDAGVGSQRRILIAQINRQTVLAPDNGLVTWPWRRLPNDALYELTWRPKRQPSATFHGRDIFAPAALLLASGKTPPQIARPIEDPVLLPIRPATSINDRIVILHIDHFGNATTNLPAEALPKGRPHAIGIRRRRIPVLRTYADVPEGKPLALIGSSSLLEIAVRNGNAARLLRLRVGQPVKIKDQA
jgi:S-adenosylmethionine hydrolase